MFVGMDMETFGGEHQWEGTGILEFLKWLFRRAREEGGVSVESPGDAAAELDAREGISIEPGGAPRPGPTGRRT